MQVATIKMPKHEAKDKLDEYLDGLRDREPTREDQGVVLGLKALAKGKSLINVADVLRACPLTEAEKAPKLAVARANWTWAHLRSNEQGGASFGYSQWIGNEDNASAYRVLRFPVGTLSAAVAQAQRQRRESLRALVPMIPPNLRPYKAIQEYVILFEAEWQPVAPKDPMLLRPLQWPLCVVIAHWDLTELERAVLSGRLTQR